MQIVGAMYVCMFLFYILFCPFSILTGSNSVRPILINSFFFFVLLFFYNETSDRLQTGVIPNPRLHIEAGLRHGIQMREERRRKGAEKLNSSTHSQNCNSLTLKLSRYLKSSREVEKLRS
ncbi:hypothetical protein F4781DRAFT_407832 [Annulohypoxylon bovei var. microspora]|nr:hypothetical protein F4781DRAFT_407832 [Annulohypoxylon bovei var. microspora]